MDKNLKKKLGAFYTPDKTSDFILSLIKNENTKTFLEPSFGDGSFLRSIKKHSPTSRITAIDIDENAVSKFTAVNDISNIQIFCRNFLEIKNISFDCAVGNPPFVRQRSLSESEINAANEIIVKNLGDNFPKDVSLWLPFLIHSIDLLNKNGSLGFVLPYEITFVNYANDIWSYICKRFGSVKVIRIKERIFPEIMQEVIILILEKKGGVSASVNYKGYKNIDEASDKKHLFNVDITIDQIRTNKKIFKYALISEFSSYLWNEKILPNTIVTREVCDFHIGYVSGHKEFFHPTRETIKNYSISQSHLIDTIAQPQTMKNKGIFTSNIINPDNLFYPDLEKSKYEVQSYIKYGETIGVQNRYKCKIRKHWYKVPLVKKSDLLMSVFNDAPILMVNDAGYLCTNSILCGYLKNTLTADFSAAWYSPLTSLSIELEVHSLGGGMLVFVPNEVGNIRMLKPFAGHEKNTTTDFLMRSKNHSLAYLNGTKEMKNILQLTNSEIDEILSATEELKSWRII
jgi:adenine-specific DNA-methyltransferase